MAKIGDLGIAKLLTKTMAAKTQIGTPHYMPPEIWRNRPYGFSSDSWAIGCLLYEMATYSVPFEARSMSELRYKVLRGTYPPVPSTYSRELQQMVKDCLDSNPDRRPSMDQILNNQAVASRMHLLDAVSVCWAHGSLGHSTKHCQTALHAVWAVLLISARNHLIDSDK